MKWLLTSLWLSICFGLFITGCGIEIVGDPSPEPVAEAAPLTEEEQEEFNIIYSGSVSFTALEFEGSLGTVEEFEGSVWLERGVQANGVATLEVQAEEQGSWAAMGILNIHGGLMHPMVRPGFEYSFTRENNHPYGIHVSLLGCSGSRRNVWTHDERAEKVHVAIEQGALPWERVLRFTASFGTGDIVRGRLTYRIIGGRVL